MTFSHSKHPYATNPLRTRSDLARALTEGFLDPLAPRTSPGGARIKLGHTATHYDEVAAQLEGFARPLWGLASLLAGGGTYPGAERWVRGFANGTDPTNESEYWGATRDRDQRMVEMSPIGFSLAVAGDGLWKGLSEKERENVGNWLRGINEKEMPNTNWLWFRVFANLGLAKVGEKYDADRLKKDLDHLDTFYLGDGWSRDGPEGVRQLDYYSGSFAIQYAQLVYAKLAADTDPDRAREYKDRGAKYAHDFLHYFDEDGGAIPFGRSTTYRMAMASFWAALAYTFTPEELSSLLPPYLAEPGVIKGLLLRNLRWWSRHSDTIFASDGTLTIGYVYPNMYMTENYNSPGSPYWGMKAFLVLALSEDHPFWTQPELPHPISALSKHTNLVPRILSLKHPLHIMVSAQSNTYLLSSGQACHYPLKATQAKYGKFAYSEHFGFCVPTGSYMLDQHALDNMLGLSDDGGEIWKSRRIAENARIELFNIDDGRKSAWPVLISAWHPWNDVEVETWLVPPPPPSANFSEKVQSDWHFRIHRIKTARSILSAEGGWAIYGQGCDGRTLSTPYNPTTNEGRSPPDANGSAYAVSAAGVSGVHNISVPSSVERQGDVLNVDANANLIWNRTVLPTLYGKHERADGEKWLVTGVFGLGVKGMEVPADWRSRWESVNDLGKHIPEALRRRVGLA